MDMDKTLDPLDRATMATWKASNMVAWGLVALACALVLHTVADELLRHVHIPTLTTMNRRPSPFFSTWQSVAPQYGYRAFFAIVTGVLIGLIVGRKALRGPAWTAMTVAGAYVLISWVALESSIRFINQSGDIQPTLGVSGYGVERQGFPSSARDWTYSLVALLAVAVAAFVARSVSKRRTRGDVSPGTP